VFGLGWVEGAKRGAAVEAIRLVRDGFIVGLGSGSTVAYAIAELGRRVRSEGLHVLGVPTSFQALELAVRHGIPLTTLHEHPELDLAIDGADQVDSRLNLIKGLGAALTREKVVAASAKLFVVVVDERKLVETLGGGVPVPVEVLPFAVPLVMRRLGELGLKAAVRTAGKGKVGPVITDNGNVILDIKVDAVEEPAKLDKQLKQIPGVIETGLFVDMADIVYVGGREGVRKIERGRKVEKGWTDAD